MSCKGEVILLTHEEQLLFGERIRKRRDDIGFTQEYVANKADISLRFYQEIEGGRKNVSVDTLIRLSNILSISIDYLLLGSLAYSLENPISKVLECLSPQQQADATQILRLYSKACQRQEQE